MIWGVPLFLETSIYDISVLVFACSFIKHGYSRIGSRKKDTFFVPEEITMAILDFMFLYSFLAKSLSYTYHIAVNTRPLSTFTTQIVVDLGNPVCLVRWLSTYHIFHPSEIDLSRGAFVTCMGSTALNISSHATPYQLVPGSWGLASNRSSLLADSSVLFQILVSCQKTNAGTPWLDENACKDWHLHPFSVV